MTKNSKLNIISVILVGLAVQIFSSRNLHAQETMCKGTKIIQQCDDGRAVIDPDNACGLLATNNDYNTCLMTHAPSVTCAPYSGTQSSYDSCLASHSAAGDCFSLAANSKYTECQFEHTTYPSRTCRKVRVACDYQEPPKNIFDALGRIFQPAR